MSKWSFHRWRRHTSQQNVRHGVCSSCDGEVLVHYIRFLKGVFKKQFLGVLVITFLKLKNCLFLWVNFQNIVQCVIYRLLLIIDIHYYKLRVDLQLLIRAIRKIKYINFLLKIKLRTILIMEFISQIHGTLLINSTVLILSFIIDVEELEGM